MSTAEFTVACEQNVFIYILDRNAPEGEVAAAFEYKVQGDAAGWKAVQELDPFLSPEMKTVKNINIEFMRMIGIDGRRLLEELRENSSDTVPIMYSGLEKIEIIRGLDLVYRLDHAVTATQKTILSAFDMDVKYVQDKAKRISEQIRNTIGNEG